MKSQARIKRCLGVLGFIVFFLFFSASGALGQGVTESDETRIETEGAGMVSRVAPGESLPMSVKLLNFGEGEKVDVTIHYKIFDKEEELMIHETETVAVETTASFERDIPIPDNFPTGRYTAYSEIEYKGQKVPAVSQFQFTVENEFWGIFISDLILYTVITLVVAVLVIIATRFVIKERKRRFAPHTYSDVKKEDRIYYELMSDMIMQMRYREGDKAVELAKEIDGLEIDEDTGRIKNISKDPAEIITLLMIQYQKNFGKKKADVVSKKVNKKAPKEDEAIDKNLEMIRKYFK